MAVRAWDMSGPEADPFGDLEPQLPGLEAAREGVESERGAVEAARRARSRLRRYCVKNKLDRLWTLTYAGAGEWDEDRVARDVARMVKALRALLGDRPFAYAWTRELHPDGHGYHVHMALGKFVHVSVVERAWQYENARSGFVFAVRIRTRAGGRNAARQAARYLSKYVAKEAERQVSRGKSRYQVAQGFKVRQVEALAFDLAEARHIAKTVVGEDISWQWASVEVEDWRGPPCVLWVF